MLLQPDCIPCILKMALSSVRRLSDQELMLKDLMGQVLQIPALQGLVWDRPCSEVIVPVMEVIQEAFNSLDPFQPLKRAQNKNGLELYPHLQRLVQESSEPLLTAVHLAILGNSIDLMVSDHSIDPKRLLAEKLKDSLDQKSYLAFRKKIEDARTIVYLADNAGEILFDKVFIETIRERFDPQIFLIMRSVPTLNDVTLQEARDLGMDQVATLMENGINVPLPGTNLSQVSSDFRELFQKADLIISKGGGNFGTLEEEKDLPPKVTYLLLSKCLPYCRRFNSKMYQPILANNYS
jgi:uncharacterized protein with ATP-grasp and redox domains